MKYCEDTNCPKFNGGTCQLGFELHFRVPKSMADVVHTNWGWVMPKACRNRERFRKEVKR